MACIAVPERGEGHHPAFALADLVVDSLLEVDGAVLDELSRRHALGAEGDPGALRGKGPGAGLLTEGT